MLNVKLCSQGIFRTNLNIYNGAFFTSVKQYFKNILNWIALRFHSLHNSPFHEKTYNSENFRRSLLLTMEHFSFQNSKLCNRMVSSINRSSHQRCSIRKGILRNFAKFTGKHLYQSLFFGTKVFLWIFRNFLEHLFYRTRLGDCFWTKKVY